MSAPVDVLAVMEIDARAIACVIDSCSPGGMRQLQWESHQRKHAEARVAVAELIAATAAYRKGWSSEGCPDPTCVVCKRNARLAASLDAALARCTGGQS